MPRSIKVNMPDVPLSSHFYAEAKAVAPCLPGFDITPPAEAKPFLRWAGGKTRLLDAILPHVPQIFRAYHEPFLGSGAVFFAVRHRGSGGSHLADLNPELINIWKVVRDCPDAFLSSLNKYRDKNSEEDYYEVRAESPTTELERAARFFYLNQTAWNGLWRENKNGVFNVPWGARPFRGIENDVVYNLSKYLRGVELEVSDFRTTLQYPKVGDFVYLDPPYLPISDTSKFSGYTGRRFRAPDLKELAAICHDLTDRGVSWVLSNRDTPLVRELFSHAHIIRFTTWRSVSAQNKRNVQPSASPEVLIVGGRL